MRRYKRFEQSRGRTPVLFFVGAFALLTATLALVFVKVNSLPSEVLEDKPARLVIDPLLKPLTPAPQESEYDEKISSILEVLTKELTQLWGNREDQQWEQKAVSLETRIDAQARVAGAAQAVIAQRVPASKKQKHLTLVIQLQELEQGISDGQLDIIEENLVKLELKN